MLWKPVCADVIFFIPGCIHSAPKATSSISHTSHDTATTPSFIPKPLPRSLWYALLVVLVSTFGASTLGEKSKHMAKAETETGTVCNSAQPSTAWLPTAALDHWKTYPDTEIQNSAPRDAILHSFQNKQSSCILKYQLKKKNNIADYLPAKQAVLILALYRQEYILVHINTVDLNQLINIDVNLWKFIVYTMHR